MKKQTTKPKKTIKKKPIEKKLRSASDIKAMISYWESMIKLMPKNTVMSPIRKAITKDRLSARIEMLKWVLN